MDMIQRTAAGTRYEFRTRFTLERYFDGQELWLWMRVHLGQHGERWSAYLGDDHIWVITTTNAEDHALVTLTWA